MVVVRIDWTKDNGFLVIRSCAARVECSEERRHSSPATGRTVFTPRSAPLRFRPLACPLRIAVRRSSRKSLILSGDIRPAWLRRGQRASVAQPAAPHQARCAPAARDWGRSTARGSLRSDGRRKGRRSGGGTRPAGTGV